RGDEPATTQVNGQNKQTKDGDWSKTQSHNHVKPVHADEPMLPDGKEKEGNPKQQKDTTNFRFLRIPLERQQGRAKDERNGDDRPKQAAEPQRISTLPAHGRAVALNGRQRILQKRSQMRRMLSGEDPTDEKPDGGYAHQP